MLAASCHAIAGGCSELVDPVAFYRTALTKAGAEDVQKTTLGGRPAYRFVLPVQRGGPGVTGVEQVVTVDATSFQPRRIVWQEHPEGGATRTDRWQVLDIVSIADISQTDEAGAFTLDIPAGVQLVQLDESRAHSSERRRSGTFTPGASAQRFPHGTGWGTDSRASPCQPFASSAGRQERRFVWSTAP